ncbi:MULTISPECIES: hypothetical protein [unclassified Nocardioides]|uniref:hypothetical protein n=1 Tax=unclassified Nocardioides TaxID=2615069 RepID=UPI0006FF8D69|nr:MULTISPECIES: hypothetical protein [unclassified Nocardioides]KRA38865.1 hypothetical protein ASD81_09820 [Nocardioides sp. Root614]KRA92825.1 hypothetical protein ASD84_10085 [Nocardioides sp. Root682]
MSVIEVLGELVRRAVANQPGWHISSTDMTEWVAGTGLTRDALLGDVALELARRYDADALTFEIADAVANSLHFYVTLQDANRPEVFDSVFDAFDEGEYFHDSDRTEDPELAFTRPLIRKILASQSRADVAVNDAPPVEHAGLVPVDGFVTTVRFDGWSPVAWWGTGPHGDEILATEGCHVALWSSPEECLRTVRERGWRLADDDGVENTDVTELDFEPAQSWLRGASTSLDTKAGLDLWNFAIDVAHSLGRPFRHRGRLADRCHHKLTAANVPRAFGVETYAPRWTAAEIRVLRRVLGEAVHVVRSGLGERTPDRLR